MLQSIEPFRSYVDTFQYSLNVQFQNNYGLLNLEIEVTSAKDAGRYLVRAVNSEGEAETNAKVEVKGQFAT